MRPCGDCTMCCKHIAIAELEKPQGIWCKYCAPKRDEFGGCTIHEERPDACRAFFCLWAKGLGSERMRPDRSKVIFTQMIVDDASTIVAIVPPESFGTIKSGEVAGIINKLSGGGNKVMITVGDKAFGVGAWT